jgi:protein Mpv17
MSRLHILLTTAALLSPSALAFSTPFSLGHRQQRYSSTRRHAELDEAITGGASAIDTFFQTQPYVSAFVTCSVKASAADYIAQSQALESDEVSEEDALTTASSSSQGDSVANAPAGVDISRNMAFIFYGGLYSGLAQQFFYTVMFPAWFGHAHTWQTVALEVGTDMAVIGPFLCLPIAYVVKTAFTDELTVKNVKLGLEKYVEDVKLRGLLFKYWAVWIPAQSLTFSVIPEHFRILFVAAISFFWMFILSSTSAATDDPSAEA